MKRRTHSCANVMVLEVAHNEDVEIEQPVTDTPSHTVELPKATRFRRASFALTGERQTVLDDLVATASENAVSRAAAAVVLDLGASNTCSIDPIESAQTAVSSDVGSLTRPSSSSTVNNVALGSVSTESTSSASFSVTHSDQHDDQMHTCRYFNDAFSSSPLSSNLVKRYLAQIATSDPPATTTSSQRTETPTVSGCSPLFPSSMSHYYGLVYPTVASMTIPVVSLRRAHAATSSKHRMFTLDKTPTGSEAPSDVPFCASDVDCWSGRTVDNPWGYQSDSCYMMDTSPKAKKPIYLNERRVFQHHHHHPVGTYSLCPSPSVNKRRISVHQHAAGRLATHNGRMSSPRSASFDLLHVYDGLPATHLNRSLSPTSSRGSVRSLDRLHQHSSPSTTNTESESKTNHHAFDRLRSLFNQLKPNEDSENYFYMDDETLERRAASQVSNVILPVSF